MMCISHQQTRQSTSDRCADSISFHRLDTHSLCNLLVSLDSPFMDAKKKVRSAPAST